LYFINARRCSSPDGLEHIENGGEQQRGVPACSSVAAAADVSVSWWAWCCSAWRRVVKIGGGTSGGRHIGEKQRKNKYRRHQHQ